MAGSEPRHTSTDGTTIFLCGDVMLGRGVDQILAHPCDPHLVEDYLDSALAYGRLAEAAHGALPRAASGTYVWGDALSDLREFGPQARIVNLETAITKHGAPWPKGINYRMSPANARCLRTFGVDCCVLANNHVMDWGTPGLLETLATLERLDIRQSGAGRDLEEASRPGEIETADGHRILVFAFGHSSSGIPQEWAATAHQPGLRHLPDFSPAAIDGIADTIAAHRRTGDLVVVSMHWGSNWGYGVTQEQRAVAHALVDAGVCDILHGHSSHHPRPIEIYRGRLILYGCGDFINDYEGIRGQEAFRPDLCLAYLPSLGSDGALKALTLLPYRIRRFRLEAAGADDALWLESLLNRLGLNFACRLAADSWQRLGLIRI
jgi:poly-gamma-glutamate capsule biosynthesis protein CapA/YwtB (metallophosphatase superfamily)